MGSNQSCTVIKQGDWEHHLCWIDPAPQGIQSQVQSDISVEVKTTNSEIRCEILQSIDKDDLEEISSSGNLQSDNEAHVDARTTLQDSTFKNPSMKR